jgi:hypothetical protein
MMSENTELFIDQRKQFIESGTIATLYCVEQFSNRVLRVSTGLHVSPVAPLFRSGVIQKAEEK